eukprot:10151802-Prorocentrum_lima.AAC.1
MIRRPPRSTHYISSAASDVYKRQDKSSTDDEAKGYDSEKEAKAYDSEKAVSYTHLRAHETRRHL